MGEEIKIYYKLETYKENISSIQNYQGLFPELGSCQVQLCTEHNYLTLMVQWQSFQL
jgi:hypothetical protein